MINNVIQLFSNNMWLICYLMIINVVTFIAFGIDKALAIGHLSRVSEATLMFLSLLGGSLFGMFGMKVFHHKTLKPLFRFGLPIICILHIVLIFYLANR